MIKPIPRLSQQNYDFWRLAGNKWKFPGTNGEHHPQSTRSFLCNLWMGLKHLLVVDYALDYGLYARGYVGKEIEARNRLDLVHAHPIGSPITVNGS